MGEMKQLESLMEFRKPLNVHPVLENNVRNMFRLLNFFVKVFSFTSSIIFCNVNMTYCILFNVLVHIRVCPPFALNWHFILIR